MLTGVQCSYKPLLSVFILDEALTLALGNDEEIIGRFSLLDFHLFWLTHNQLNLSNYIVFYLGVKSED